MLITKEILLSYLQQDSFNLSIMHLSPTIELFYMAGVCCFWPQSAGAILEVIFNVLDVYTFNKFIW